MPYKYRPSPLPWTFRPHFDHSNDSLEARIVDLHGNVIALVYDTRDAEYICAYERRVQELEAYVSQLEETVGVLENKCNNEMSERPL